MCHCISHFILLHLFPHRRCRESYYKEVTRVFSVLSEELSKRLQVLTQSSSRTRELLEKQHDHLKKLLREKVFDILHQDIRLFGTPRLTKLRLW